VIQVLIPFRTTATACLVALVVLLAGAGVAQAKILYSPVLETANAEDQFLCGFHNTHTSRNTNISFRIYDVNSGGVIVEQDIFVLEPTMATAYLVDGPGAFMCVIDFNGGKLQIEVGLRANGRMDEVQVLTK
jgi:hypothetical protein